MSQFIASTNVHIALSYYNILFYDSEEYSLIFKKT